MPEQKVLLAIDPSEFSAQAFDYYAKNLHMEGNQVVLLYVVDVTNLSSKGHPPSYEKMQKKVEEEEKQVAAIKGKFQSMCEEKQVPNEFKLVHSAKPGEAIVQVAEEEGVNYVVTGTRGLGKMRRTIMGSVSDYVVHHAHCPVIVCRH